MKKIRSGKLLPIFEFLFVFTQYTLKFANTKFSVQKACTKVYKNMINFEFIQAQLCTNLKWQPLYFRTSWFLLIWMPSDKYVSIRIEWLGRKKHRKCESPDLLRVKSRFRLRLRNWGNLFGTLRLNKKIYVVLKLSSAFISLCASVCLEMKDTFFLLILRFFFGQKLAILDYCVLYSIYNGQNNINVS